MTSARINPDLLPLARPLADLHCDPKNARKHGKRDLDTIAKSLDLHGQQKPIVAMRDGKVIAGNGTLEAARALGWDRIACVTYDDEDAAKAAAFAIVDNRSAELSEWDFDTLLVDLRSLPADMLSSTGFNADDLATLMPTGDPLGAALAALPHGERSTFATMTFTLTVSQREDVLNAVAACLRVRRADGPVDGEDESAVNRNSIGLHRIALAYLASVQA